MSPLELRSTLTIDSSHGRAEVRLTSKTAIGALGGDGGGDGGDGDVGGGGDGDGGGGIVDRKREPQS